MKDKIREIVDEFHNRPQFLNNCTVSLTLNYVQVIPDYEYLDFNEESYQRIIRILWNSDIKNYNITFRIDRGADDLPYDKDWKDVSFIFFGGESEEPNRVPDIENYGLFAFNSLGASGDIRTGNIWELSKLTQDEDGRDMRVWNNYYNYRDISKLVDIMVEFDELLDRQLQEKFKIYDKFKSLT